jgi:hypothetical protein
MSFYEVELKKKYLKDYQETIREYNQRIKNLRNSLDNPDASLDNTLSLSGNDREKLLGIQKLEEEKKKEVAFLERMYERDKKEHKEKDTSYPLPSPVTFEKEPIKTELVDPVTFAVPKKTVSTKYRNLKIGTKILFRGMLGGEYKGFIIGEAPTGSAYNKNEVKYWVKRGAKWETAKKKQQEIVSSFDVLDVLKYPAKTNYPFEEPETKQAVNVDFPFQVGQIVKDEYNNRYFVISTNTNDAVLALIDPFKDKLTKHLRLEDVATKLTLTTEKYKSKYLKEVSNHKYTLLESLRLLNYKYKVPRVKKPVTCNYREMWKFLKGIVDPKNLYPNNTVVHYDQWGITATDSHKLVHIDYTMLGGGYNTCESMYNKSYNLGGVVDEKYYNYSAVVPTEDALNIKEVDLVELYNYTELALKIQAFNPVTTQGSFKALGKPIGFNLKFLNAICKTLLTLDNNKFTWRVGFTEYPISDSSTFQNRAVVFFPQFQPGFDREQSTYGLIMPVMLNVTLENVDLEQHNMPMYGTFDLDYNRQFPVYFDFDLNSVVDSEGNVINLKDTIDYEKKQGRINGVENESSYDKIAAFSILGLLAYNAFKK